MSGNKWLVVKTRRGHELQVCKDLNECGYEAFVPTFEKEFLWADRTRHLTRVVFPLFVFCRVKSTTSIKVVQVPGVIGIVRSKLDDYVAEDEINALKYLCEQGAFVPHKDPLTEGDFVEICRGPLKGKMGSLIKVKGPNRIVVLIEVLRRSVAVEVDPIFLRKSNGIFSSPD